MINLPPGAHAHRSSAIFLRRIRTGAVPAASGGPIGWTGPELEPGDLEKLRLALLKARQAGLLDAPVAVAVPENTPAAA